MKIIFILLAIKGSEQKVCSITRVVKKLVRVGLTFEETMWTVRHTIDFDIEIWQLDSAIRVRTIPNMDLSVMGTVYW